MDVASFSSCVCLFVCVDVCLNEKSVQKLLLFLNNTYKRLSNT